MTSPPLPLTYDEHAPAVGDESRGALRGAPDQLAQAALATLSEPRLRAYLVAHRAEPEFTYGVLHYYFTDKVDLISECVRVYDTAPVANFDEA